tara:strand:- start:178 stop:336 length:159 start_codon:yes stop_codon:yes gene_type:complete
VLRQQGQEEEPELEPKLEEEEEVEAEEEIETRNGTADNNILIWHSKRQLNGT